MIRPSGKPNGETVLIMLTGMCRTNLSPFVFIVDVLSGIALFARAWVIVVENRKAFTVCLVLMWVAPTGPVDLRVT